VRAGYAHTCATRTTGSLWCWGSNSYGQLGDGTTTTRLTPTRIGTATTWTTLAAA
jgi:alpha-tubulin suppressor-like RCC1 family protein